MELENITDNMNYAGNEGKWYSYIDNMDYYRIRLLYDEYTIWKATETGQVLADTPETNIVLNYVIRSMIT